ncbi:MAG: hypothetical protein IT463_01180 [Planctomycetes bacterium]|nr:hypothetical protein [Planctomycetota bacterium]
MMAPLLGAQDLDRDLVAALEDPAAVERERAKAALGDKLPQHYRQVLDHGAAPVLLVDALATVGRLRKPEDIPRIVRYVGSLDPQVASASVESLRRFGHAGIAAVQALDNAQIDEPTRKKVMDILLRDHVTRCCKRDVALNPMHLDYSARFDELLSVQAPLHDLLLSQLREVGAEVRQEFSGTGRNWYYGMENSLVNFGGLAVALLGRDKPDLLEREFEDLTRNNEDEDRGWWGWVEYSPVATELAIFFARRGKPVLLDTLISRIEQTTRWMEPSQAAMIGLQVAALQFCATGDTSSALPAVLAAIQAMGANPSGSLAHAHYLRARILLAAGEQGEALHALEDAMECGPVPVALALVDNAFSGLADERRYRNVLRCVELGARRLPSQDRPWRKEDQADLAAAADPDLDE